MTVTVYMISIHIGMSLVISRQSILQLVEGHICGLYSLISGAQQKNHFLLQVSYRSVELYVNGA